MTKRFRTIANWKSQHEDFLHALKGGGLQAIKEIADRLDGKPAPATAVPQVS